MLQREVNTLKAKVSVLEEVDRAITVPIQTFAPEPYEVVKPFSVVLEPSGDEYTATFYDANVASGGDTPEEAVSNARELILDIYDILMEEDEEQLGPLTRRQREVLSEFVRKRV